MSIGTKLTMRTVHVTLPFIVKPHPRYRVKRVAMKVTQELALPVVYASDHSFLDIWGLGK